MHNQEGMPKKKSHYLLSKKKEITSETEVIEITVDQRLHVKGLKK